jgi:dihydrofolate reductase
MSKVRVAAFSVSLDGFGAGPRQDLQNPLGVRGLELHNWLPPTEIFRKMQGQSGGTTGIDNDFVAQSFQNVGAWILGRNMFGPVRGPWRDDSWKGWWGDNPPYHTQVWRGHSCPRTCTLAREPPRSQRWVSVRKEREALGRAETQAPQSASRPHSIAPDAIECVPDYQGHPPVRLF